MAGKRVSGLKPLLQAAAEADKASTELLQSEAAMQQWQQSWDDFNEEQRPRQQAEVQQSQFST